MSVTQYVGNFQSERPVGAARIKDILYIFNGSYPVYYTGDGELYMFPEYQPTFSEQVVAGPNTMMDDFEDYYYNRDFNLPNNQSSDRLELLDFDFRPRIPYQIKPDTETDPQIEIRISYKYNQDADYLESFSQFVPDKYLETVSSLPDYESVDYDFYFANKYIVYDEFTEAFYETNEEGTGWDQLAPTRSNGFETHYEIVPKVYFRNSSVGESELDWIEVDEENIDYPIRSNKFPGSEEVRIVDGVKTVLNKVADINTNQPIQIKIDGLTSGLKDIKVDLLLKRQRYATFPDNPEASRFRNVTRFQERLTPFVTAEFDEVEITAEKLQNFPTEEEPTRGGFTRHAPWSCNQVIEHYGKLIAFGSEEQPETAFVSSVENFAYFPYNYTIDFNNDLKEGINSMVPFMNILVVQSDSYTWGLKGSSPQIYIDDLGQDLNPNAYQVITINSSVGTIAPKSVRPVRNRLYFLSQEGLMELTSLFATDDRYNVKPIDRNIWNLIPQDRQATAIQFDNQYWINFPSTGQTFRYYIDKQAWVKDSVNWSVFNGLHKYYIKEGRLHFITQPSVVDDGNYAIYEGVVDYSLATDFGQPVISQFLTSKMNQEYPFHWKRYKELKLDFSIQNEYMPNRAPVEILNYFVGMVGNDITISFDSSNLTPNHSYTLAFPTELPNDLEVTIDGLVPENISIKAGMIRFELPADPPESINIQFTTTLPQSTFNDPTLVDDTYDAGIVYDLRVMADNNTMIRDDYKNYTPIEKTIDTGSEFGDITFGNTNFGDVTTFVQTTKLYGSGYDINVYYKDASNIKWTLETMGITYKMRRTRSDRRGG